jgi:hypothetical protein
MKAVLTTILIYISFSLTAQQDVTLYTGINGKIVEEEYADRKKEVVSRPRGNIRVTTYARPDGTWQVQYRENFKRLRDNEFRLRAKGVGILGDFVRKYEPLDNGMFRFEEFQEGTLVKTGYSRGRFPLILDGEVIEYYGNRQIKSRSVYSSNQLVSNENWYENGAKYVDNIFYSADEDPMYSKGMTGMHQHLRSAFLESGVDVASVSGNILLGFVVMEDGSIEGIRVLKGIAPALNAVAVNAIKTLEGTWAPARLNSKEVRYFQLFPINFIYRENRFESVEFNGSMLHWDIN